METPKSNLGGKALGDFDEFAKDYRQVHNEHLKFSGADSDYFSEQKIKVVRSIETETSPGVLDLGCGDGNSARFFRKHFPACGYSGVDTSQVSIELAEERKIDGARFVYYDGERIPFPDESFDIVFVACVFHHIDPSAHQQVLSEIKRVLRSGGRLYLFEHNPFNPLTRRIVKNCPFDEDAILLRSGYTRKMLNRSNFAEIEIGYTVFFPNHRIFRGLHGLEPYLKWLPLGGQYYARAVKGNS
jgi:ubiquinone/menaquinone biosynthesis C-methylase UbiE